MTRSAPPPVRSYCKRKDKWTETERWQREESCFGIWIGAPLGGVRAGAPSNVKRGTCELQSLVCKDLESKSGPMGGNLNRQNLDSTDFLIMNVFQENKVVSPLSLGVCKQNTHLPMLL